MDGSLKFETTPELFGDYLESNIRVLMFQAKHVDNKVPGNAIIRGNETDMFIVLLANVQKLTQSHLWFDTGLDCHNTLKYVDIIHRSFLESTHILISVIYFHLTEKGKSVLRC